MQTHPKTQSAKRVTRLLENMGITIKQIAPGCLRYTIEYASVPILFSLEIPYCYLLFMTTLSMDIENEDCNRFLSEIIKDITRHELQRRGTRVCYESRESLYTLHEYSRPSGTRTLRKFQLQEMLDNVVETHKLLQNAIADATVYYKNAGDIAK